MSKLSKIIVMSAMLGFALSSTAMTNNGVSGSVAQAQTPVVASTNNVNKANVKAVKKNKKKAVKSNKKKSKCKKAKMSKKKAAKKGY